MKLLYKRILIIFSVALNIGFLIMAGTMFINHVKSSEVSKLGELVHSLDISEAQEKKVMNSIHRLKSEIDKQEEKINLARSNILTLASKSGPLDENQLQQLYKVLNQEDIKKNTLFNSHVIELRTILGDEKSAQFYSLILEHTKNRDNSNRR